VAQWATDADKLGGQPASFYRDAANLTGTLPTAVLPLATASQPGALTATDKQKLDLLSPGAYLTGLSGSGPVSVGSGTAPSISVAAATATNAGLLSATDKQKLDLLSPGAYLTGLSGSGPVSVDAGTTPSISVAAATATNAGLLSAADKQKLDLLAPGAYLTGLSGSGPVSVGTGPTPSISVAVATATNAGLLSAADKQKLDGVGTGPSGVAVTGANRPSAPVEGQLFFNTTNKQLDIYTGGAWVVVNVQTRRSCLELKQRGLLTGNGTYSIDPDGTGPGGDMTVFCDANSSGGGWTEVYRSADNLNSTSVGYASGTSPVLSAASEMMFAYLNESTNAISNAWTFAMPSTFASAAPMSATQCGYTSITARRVSDGTTLTRLLRYGWGSFGSLCDEGCSSTWGQICLKSSSTQGTGGGESDFPHYASYANTVADHCSLSSEGYTTTTCSASRRFVILVR
jgi:hypothetical protein